LIRLSNKIFGFPVIHGKAAFTDALREHLLHHSYDYLAVELPEYLHHDLQQACAALPVIQAVTVQNEDNCCYIPTDPCDAMIEAIRQSDQQHKTILFTAPDVFPITPALPFLPDPWISAHIGLEQYYLSTLAHLLDVPLTPKEEYWISHSVHFLQQIPANATVLFLCRFHHLPRYQYYFSNISELKIKPPPPQVLHTNVYEMESRHLYFAMNELPFYAAEYEKNRQNPLVPHPDYPTLVKRLLQETRLELQQDLNRNHKVSITRLQIALTFIRNLSLQNNTLHPDLFDLVIGAKGVFGDSFAIRVIEAARYYPFFSFESKNEKLRVGPEHVRLPGNQEIVDAFNFFENPLRQWRNISLRRAPDQKEQNKSYRFDSSQGYCSHTPEDQKIENFNSFLRKSTLKHLSEFSTKNEKFTTSLKDGLDIRETLRNWHTGSIYVKELPNCKTKIDTVIILFDLQNDEKYPLLTTWYAEHEQESTLSFYATDPEQNVIGPGIARAYYGGLSLLFPPRPIPSVQNSVLIKGRPLHEALCEAALMHSQERTISLVSPQKPGIALREMANAYGKQIVWQPLSRFNQETLERLHTFHILENKDIRSFASRFIGF
jgi:hypothetical protein